MKLLFKKAWFEPNRIKSHGAFVSSQGCQMVSFQTKNPNSGKYRRALDWKVLIFMALWNILQTFGIFYDNLVHFVFICHIFSRFGSMYQEKFGTIWYILCSFGTLFHLWYHVPRKIWQPWFQLIFAFRYKSSHFSEAERKNKNS
jgi:hypothetical protein